MIASDEESDAILEEKAVSWLTADRAKAVEAGGLLWRQRSEAWLGDAAAEKVTSAKLAETIAAVAAGRFSEGILLSRAAVVAYSGAPAHRARAALEEVNALNRLKESAACREAAMKLASEATRRAYYWIAAQSLTQRAVCDNMTGDARRALVFYGQARQLAQRHRLEGLELRVTGIMASIRLAEGDPAAAWQQNRDMLARVNEGPYSRNRTHQALVNYAAGAELAGWRAAAFALMDAAAATVPGNLPTAGANLSRAGSLALAAGLDAEAAAEYGAAEKIFRSMRVSDEQRRFLDSVRLLRAEAMLLRGQPAAAVALLQPMRDTDLLKREKWRRLQLLGMGQARTGRSEEALASCEMALAHSNGIVSEFASKPQRSQARRNAVETYRTYAQLLVSADRQKEALATWLAAHGSTSAPDVVFLALDNGYAVWTSRGRQFQIVKTDRNRMRASIAALLAAVADPKESLDTVRSRGRAVYDQLVTPLPPETFAGGTVSILPDLEISSLPFHALTVPEGGWLADKVSLVLAAHGDVEPRFEIPTAALAAGVPVPRERLPSLPESRAEAGEVAARWKGARALIDNRATVDAVLTGLQNADLFHFSGHGYLTATVGGLWLADGPLSSVSLRRTELSRCRLAVLSACATAVGQQEGLTNPESLVHAMLDAGARQVVASRWPVDSSATRRLMTEFYDRLTESGYTAAALRNAMRRLRTEKGFAHPYYWAAFQVYSQ